MHLRALVYIPKGSSPSPSGPPHARAHSSASCLHGHLDDLLAPSCLPSYPLLPASSRTSACIACLAMPSLSSPFAPKGRLMTSKHAAAAFLLILLSIVLFASPCEARGLRVHGKRRSSSKSSHLPAGKVGIWLLMRKWLVLVRYTLVAMILASFILAAYSNSFRLISPLQNVAATSLKADGWGTRETQARSTVHTAMDDDMMAQPDAKAKVGVAMASSTSAAGTVGVTPVVRALSQREDTGFHLDYAGPRTHTPSHN